MTQRPAKTDSPKTSQPAPAPRATRARMPERLAPSAPARRVMIEGVSPQIDCGRFPVKRTVGEALTVEADAFTDGHDAIACVLLVRREGEDTWREVPMEPLVNDRWRARVILDAPGRWLYSIEAWVDRFESWRRDLVKRIEAGQDVTVDLQIGAGLLRDAAARAPAGQKRGQDRTTLETLADRIDPTTIKGEAPQPKSRTRPQIGTQSKAGTQSKTGAKSGLETGSEPGRTSIRQASHLALDIQTVALARKYAERSRATRFARELAVWVDREAARFSTWYEMFPRSASDRPGRHGTFQDVEKRLDYVAGMGFDVLYLPPIHPIGTTHRKGVNNATIAAPGDVGSPWAIGNAAEASESGEGGHKSIHPELGTPADFRHLVAAARKKGMEIALDIAFQCSPDHPYVRDHPEWFRTRPDGTIQYAENPPKKYEDIVPFDFDTEDWRALWEELASVVEHWIGEGVKIFRVDNPHTKTFDFWEWLIERVHRQHPEVLFLSEAFTRPKVMARLAKLGFTQSYNYFPWRNYKGELTEYFTELTRTDLAQYLRPNLWPNTPDILTERLQLGGRPAFVQRFVLAATLGASYGIYGPPFELCESTPRETGSEEYLNSEKYQLRHWDLERPDSLRELIARVNRVRHESPALQQNDTLRFHGIDNDQLLCYSKSTPDWMADRPARGGKDDVILTVVNLDPHHTQSGWTDLDLGALGLVEERDPDAPFQVHDLITDARYLWQGRRNYVELDPQVVPAHILRVRRDVHREHDFDYFA